MSETDYFRAIDDGDLETLRRLLRDRPGLLEARTSPGYAPERQQSCTGLHAAIYAGQHGAARLLIDSGIDLEARTAEGRTALHDSIEFGHPAVTELLLERGAELDVCSAAILGRVERVRELLDAGPDLANDRSTGLSPLGWAAFGNQVEAARELIDRGARMDDGELQCAASVGHVEVGRFLIERGADPDDACEGTRALHAAAAMIYTDDAVEFVRMLLDAGADRDARTPDGRTALQIAEEGARRQERELAGKPGACRKKFADIAALLRARGAR